MLPSFLSLEQAKKVFCNFTIVIIWCTCGITSPAFILKQQHLNLAKIAPRVNDWVSPKSTHLRYSIRHDNIPPKLLGFSSVAFQLFCRHALTHREHYNSLLLHFRGLQGNNDNKHSSCDNNCNNICNCIMCTSLWEMLVWFLLIARWCFTG